MASTDARPIPIKNTAFRAVFPILDADGDLVTGATGLDSEVSKDQGTFADCTNEATEIATSSGMYYLDLTSTEMNADCVAVIVKTSSSGAKTTVLVFYPEEAGDINVDVTAWNGTAIPGVDTAGYPKVTIKDGTGTGEIDTTSGGVLVAAIASGAITATSIAADAITAAKIADGAIDAATFATGAITASAIAADAIGASELAADAATEIGTAVWATAARTLTAATNITSTGGTTVPQTGDSYARLGAPDGASVSADIAAVSGLINGLPFDTITGALEGLVPVSTTVVGGTGNDTTHVHLSTLTYGDDEINSMLLVILDASTGEYHSRWIEDWVSATKLATVATLPFTPTAGDFDSYWLLPIRADVTGGSGLDAAGVRAAIGLASANLDTQLDALPTAAENATAAWAAGTRTLTALDEDSTTLDLDATIRGAVGMSSANLDTQLTAIDDYLDTEVAAIKAKTDSLTFTTAGQVDAQVLSMAANTLTAAATASDFGTEVATAVWASATRTLSALGFTLGASDLAADTIGASELASDAITEIVNAVLTTAMTESYNTDGAAPTLAQAMFVTMQRLTEFAISGTTVTVRKLDGSSSAYTLTLDDATDPTSTTRAT